MTEHAQSPLARRPGAIVGFWGVPVAYGNTFTEQKLLATGAALVDLSHHGVITVTGPERLGWLDSLLSQRLDNLQPGHSTEALLLDPHGHIEHAMRIVDDGETTWLLVDENEATSLATWLERMKFMKQVEVTDVSADFATIGFIGPAVGDIEDIAEVIWHDGWPEVSVGGWRYSTQPAPSWDYSEALVSRKDLEKLAHSEAIFAGVDALEALRIAAWRPRLITERDENALPHEFDWLSTAVHLSKGCYRGQETVAKVHNLGHPPRRLVMLSLDGVEHQLPQSGDTVCDGENEVGKITSAARHYEEGIIALAIIKRNVDPTNILTVRSDGLNIPATQIVIVPPDAGRTADVPKLPRLGAVKRP